ncbi:hypothetical protein E1A91_D03G148500v1 [Gossypium mustelinum]|uniref:Uncharacterized protein n=2 Tax=Gossypium TaxID=3633 RepID=A0A5D2VPA4_GOSMU|nr:hypothetical protein ES332_D03G163600v1 [Gossypium tomentosum]TYI90810.1 hypothetical protein E1A91_D03G148500v1 [Gossypium mustelinum]
MLLFLSMKHHGTNLEEKELHQKGLNFDHWVPIRGLTLLVCPSISIMRLVQIENIIRCYH